MHGKITRVCFTFALPGGMWVEYEDGYVDWLSSKTLVDEVGEAETARLGKIAHANGMTGMWYDAEVGGRSFDRALAVAM